MSGYLESFREIGYLGNGPLGNRLFRKMAFEETASRICTVINFFGLMMKRDAFPRS